MHDLHAVIMAGGSGTRFWPASRAARPKQFLPLSGGRPLIRATLERLQGLVPEGQVWIATNPVQARALPGVLPGFPSSQVLVEPEARDTAPCVALATAAIAARNPRATIAMLPADHVVAPVEAFQRMLRRGVAIAADQTSLVTFGIEPTFPATGYGYVECGELLDAVEPRAHSVRRFREKPDRATAAQFVAQFISQGTFLWNSGIFVWSVPAILAAMQLGNPDLGLAAEAMSEAMRRGDAAAVDAAFRRAPKISIDYAVMEKAQKVAVVRAGVQWDDVGSFPALERIAPKDPAGNATSLADGASFLQLQSRANIVYAEGRRTVALFGVDNLVVVAVGDAVLVCPKEQANELKALVEYVRAAGRSDLL
jgi:mannose-1-phosphate guanylyltransferase